MAVEKVREGGKEDRKRMREDETREGRRKGRMQRKVTKEWRKKRFKGRGRERQERGLRALRKISIRTVSENKK